jgi:8-oxo-dGTP pyrophosphatase MutT (NUDIX family)
MPRGGKLANSQVMMSFATDRSNSISCPPSAGSTEKPTALNPGVKVEVDYKSVDYRGFIFVVHKQHGLMLLHCTRKKKKGPHFQLPGGHIDEFEFFAAAEQSSDSQTQLLLAARAGAARELYEETGLDVRNQLDRLEPAALRNDVEVDKHGKEILKNELKHRLYFFLPVTDDDFWSSDKGDCEAGKMHPMGAALGYEGSQLMLRLSVEHQGWMFEKDPNKSAEMLAVHSGGQGAIALRMSMARGTTSGLEETKPAATKEKVNKDPQSETRETEPLMKDKAVSTSEQEIASSTTDLLPTPQESGISKLLNCCPGWFGHDE